MNKKTRIVHINNREFFYVFSKNQYNNVDEVRIYENKILLCRVNPSLICEPKYQDEFSSNSYEINPSDIAKYIKENAI